MERLIADAAKLSDTVDAQSLSFANIVEAIHVVQKDLGITGATYEEAKKTISGSVSAMKASWSNLVTAVADDNADFEKYVKQFTSSVATVGQNILPRIRIALEGAGQLVDELFPIIIEEIPLIIEENLPILSDAAVGIIESLISGCFFKAPCIMVSLPEPDGPEIINNLPLLIKILLFLVALILIKTVGNRFSL